MKMSMRPLVETPARVPNADLIFVLAGLEARKAFGLRLLNRQLAPRILLSVGRFEIRKLPRLSLPAPINLLEIAATIPPVLRHYFVWFEGGEALAEREQAAAAVQRERSARPRPARPAHIRH